MASSGGRNRLTTFFLLLSLLFTQTGCWGGRELNARAFVTAIAFDLTKEEELQSEQYLISIQLPVPERMAGGEGQGGGEGKPFVVLGSTAQTVASGILQLQRQLDRKLFLGHTRLILISKEVAETFGINHVIDYFLRDFSVQRMARLAVVDGKAREILELQPPMGQTPSTYILNMLSPQNGSIFTYLTDLGKFLVLQSDEGIFPVLPRLSKGKETELTGGAAVLRNGHFQGWLSDNETRGLNILHNEFVESEYEVECPLHPGDQIVVGVNALHSAYRLEEAGGMPRIKVMVHGQFETREFTGPHGPEKHEEADLERAVSAAIREEIQQTIKKAQELRVDVLGIGRYPLAHHPRFWAQLDWDTEFPFFPIELEVKMDWGLTIRRLGG